MAKFLPDAALDLIGDYVDQSDNMTLCSAQPTTYTEAITTFKLADVAMTPNTDYAKANGDTSGRKITVAAKNAVPVDTSGDGTHIALVSTGDTTLRAVTTCTLQAVTSGNQVNFPTWDIETGDPT